mmetsp:Transcript_67964/g.176545  ORF Transcript_67964/g.176545 Transcript_67964/m.176545 type:complete len:184 (+) Transcript_67964:2-553(+)
MIERMSRGADVRHAASQQEAAAWQSQLEAETAALKEERRLRAELASELEGAKVAQAQAAQQMARLRQSEEEFLEVKLASQEMQVLRATGGRPLPPRRPGDGPTSVPEAAAMAIFGDLELGRSGVALGELGLGEMPWMQSADKALQSVAVLMAWRADIRLAIFGVWLLCHTLYMLGVFYTRFHH